MKKDINIPYVSHVHIAIAMAEDNDWSIYLLNRTENKLEDALVVSKGYGVRDNEDVKTSTLRHYLGEVPAHGFAVIERIDPSLFTINHEFWLTFYIKAQLFDKKFIFRAGSITEKNLSYIKELKMNGVYK